MNLRRLVKLLGAADSLLDGGMAVEEKFDHRMRSPVGQILLRQFIHAGDKGANVRDHLQSEIIRLALAEKRLAARRLWRRRSYSPRINRSALESTS